MLTGFRLEFDDGTVFRATKDIQVTHGTQPLFLLDGASNLVSTYNQWIDEEGGSAGLADSNYSAVFKGFGAGIHTIDVRIFQYEGNTDQWGNSNDGDSAVSKLQTLNRAITTKRADSEFPAILETGEYSDSGKYSPIPVAIGETNLPFDAREQSSTFEGSITFYDAIDLTNAVSAAARGQ